MTTHEISVNIPGNYPVTPKSEKNNRDSLSTKNSEQNTRDSSSTQNSEQNTLEYHPPSDPSIRPAEENNLTKFSNVGSTALGSVGVTPVDIFNRSDSPKHPFFHKTEKSTPDSNGIDTSHVIKPREIMTTQQDDKYSDSFTKEKDDLVLPNAILPEPRTYHHTNIEHKNGDTEGVSLPPPPIQSTTSPSQVEHTSLNDVHGNYNNKPHFQVSPEPMSTATPAVPHSKTPDSDFKQNTQNYKEHATSPVRDIKSDNVNQESKVTKKEKVGATIDKAVGTLKEKFGKLVKNDNLVAKGIEQRTEAEETKKLADTQKILDEI